MFPSNLHENIRDLDQQLSTLEKKCLDLVVEPKKNISNSKDYTKFDQKDKSKPFCRKNSNSRSMNFSKKAKKPSPASSNLNYTCSGQSNGIQLLKAQDFSNGYSKNKLREINSRMCQSCSNRRISGDADSSQIVKNSKKKKSNCGCECSSGELKSKLCQNSNARDFRSDSSKDCIIHQEVLYSNSEGSIELTVKQKPVLQNKKGRDLKNLCCDEYKNKSNGKDTCLHEFDEIKKWGQTWSEILSAEHVKKNKNCNKSASAKISNSNENSKSTLGKENKAESLSAIKINSDGILTQERALPNNVNKEIDMQFFSRNPQEIYLTIQKLCDNLIYEKNCMNRELKAKNLIIEDMKKKEEEYSSLISVLKLNLYRAKDAANTNANKLGELADIKIKFMKQGKILEALKKNHLQLKEMLDKYALENDRLSAEIQIYKLEIQKHEVLMAGKEAEIRAFKEEVRNFQKQIGEHLASVKSNSQAIDMKKMMEAIVQKSHVFIHDDFDSAMAKNNSKDLLRCTGLMHSSPTSAKTSDVDSSWKQISSIRTVDPVIEPETNYLEKEFYQVYGGDVSASTKQSLSKSNTPLFNQEIKNSQILFTGSPIQNGTDNLVCSTKNKNKIMKNKQEVTKISPEKIRNDINDLLQRMKMQWSSKIDGKESSDNCTVEDFLNGSSASSVYNQ